MDILFYYTGKFSKCFCIAKRLQQLKEYDMARGQGKKEKKIDLKNLEPEQKVKYEIAEELGLLDKVMQTGWGSLTAKETGKIGGIMTQRRREAKG